MSPFTNTPLYARAQRLKLADIGLPMLQNLSENLKRIEKLVKSEVDLLELNLKSYDGLKNLLRGVID
jgi:hypothetical protein